MKRIIFILMLTFPTLLFAQSFDKAIGIRGGLSSGFEFRFYTDDANSYKFLLATRDEGLQFHVFKEFHEYDLFSFSEQLTLFWGAGVHAGYEQWDKRYVRDNTSWYEEKTSMLAGVDALVGVEYLFNEIPISVGLEVKPFIDVFGQDNFDIELFDFAFTVKYLF